MEVNNIVPKHTTVYFDHAATTPVDPQVASVVYEALTNRFGNPSSMHFLGRQSRIAMQTARHQVAGLIGAKDSEIIFTSGGTESNSLAIWGVLSVAPQTKRRFITSAVEHASVLNNIPRLEKAGFTVVVLPVNSYGRVNLEDLEQALTEDTALVSIMYANNEVGTLQNITECAKVVQNHGVPMHTDAVQAAGLCRLDINKLQVDLLSISAHKLYGPKGVGALYVRKGIEIDPILLGGGQEFGMRSGTENVPGITGLGMAVDLVEERLENVVYLAELRDYLQAKLDNISEICTYGDRHNRLPNNCCFCINDYQGANLVLDFEQKGFCLSSGSACQKGKSSHVLTAMGVSQNRIKNSVRVTLGWQNTEEHIDRFVIALKQLLVQ